MTSFQGSCFNVENASHERCNTRMPDKEKKIIIIDGSSVIYRAFHAIPATFTNREGMPTNAVYGFTQTLVKLLKEY